MNKILKKVDDFFINHFEREFENSKSRYIKPFQYDNRWYDFLMVIPMLIWFYFKFKDLEQYEKQTKGR